MSDASVAAMEGFVVLAKSSKGKGCVMVIKEVLKHPQIFVFGELLEQPNVKELESSEHKPWLDLLRIFAYGTWSDYLGNVMSMCDSMAALLFFLNSQPFESSRHDRHAGTSQFPRTFFLHHTQNFFSSLSDNKVKAAFSRIFGIKAQGKRNLLSAPDITLSILYMSPDPVLRGVKKGIAGATFFLAAPN